MIGLDSKQIGVQVVFSGGGMKGFAMAGALLALKEDALIPMRYAGTSSGACLAALAAVGYEPQEILEIFKTICIRDLLKSSRWHWVDRIHGWRRFWKSGGIYRMERLERWIEQCLAKRSVITFADLPEHTLEMVVADVIQRKMVIFPDDLSPEERKGMPLAHLICMSMCLPFVFEPMTFRRSRVVDGAILSNIPFRAFGHHAQPAQIPTFVFRYVMEPGAYHQAISGPKSLIHAMVDTMIEAHDRDEIRKNPQLIVVDLPTAGISPTQFDLSASQKQVLFDLGYQTTKAALCERPELIQFRKSINEISAVHHSGPRVCVSVHTNSVV